MKVHWTHKRTIRQLYKDGFTLEELTIMWKPIPHRLIKAIVRGVERTPRV